MNKQRSWIFLRGLVRGRGHWGDFPEKFKNKFPEDSLELLDLPGNGERSAEKSPLRIADYVPLIRERSQSLREGRKVHMLALSLGGMIAVDWMRQYPQDLEKIYLVNTSAANHATLDERFQPANYLKILPLWVPHSAKRHEEIMLSLLANSEERRREVFPSLVEYTKKYPVNGANFFRQIWAASRAFFPPQAPGAVQLIGSEGDHLVSPKCSLKIAAAWKLPLKMHPWAGHDLPIDDPDWLLEQLI